MVEQELLEELIYESLKGKIISKNLIKKVVESIIEVEDEITKSTFKKLAFSPINGYNNSSLATFNEDSGIFFIDYDKFEGEGCELPFDDMLTINIDLLQHILHDIEHIKEKSKKAKKDFTSKLLMCSDPDIIYARCYHLASIQNKANPAKEAKDKYESYYLKIYDTIPSERIADIESTKMLIKSLNNYPGFESINTGTFKYINLKYFEFLMLGYRKLNRGIYSSPLIDYINAVESPYFGLKKFKMGKVKALSSKLTTEEKMTFGLAIEENDVKEIKDKQKVFSYVNK